MFRHFFIFISNILCISTLFCQSHNLVIFSATGKRFVLMVNDTKVNAIPQSNVKAFGLETGKQRIEIEFKEENDQVVLKDSFVIGKEEKYTNKEFTYAVTDELKNGRLYHTLHFVTVNDTSGPQVPVVPESLKEVVPLLDNSVYGILYKAKDNKPVFFDNYREDSKTCEVFLGEKELKYLAQLLNRCNDIEMKYNYVMQTIQNNCYTVSQLKQLVQLLTIELDKLKACKEGYWHLTDPQNAKQLNEALIYKTIQEDFTNYLNDLATIEKQEKLKCLNPIPDSELEALLKTIQAMAYENDKIKVAKKQLASNCLSTVQLTKITSLFAHDREKLEFVKASFKIVTDKENFHNMADVFLFAETKDEFKRYFNK